MPFSPALIFDPFFIILLLIVLFNILLFAFVFSKLALFKGYEDKNTDTPPVSVIISAKNEEDNLVRFLPSVLKQDYPDFEVLVVNDQSTDYSLDVLHQYQKQYAHLVVINIEDHIKDHLGKKLALTLALKKARHEIILLTDADCQPTSNLWIRQMVENYKTDTEIVLGVSVYEKRNTLLNHFIQFETFFTALQYLSFCLDGMPYMGVGRNLSYRKNLFFEHKGFSAHLHLASGDDDLFVNQAATATNTRVEIRPESDVITQPPESFTEWFRQKIRHLQAGKEYRKKHQRWLGVVALLQLLFFAALIYGAIQWNHSWLFWSLAAFRYVAVFTVYAAAARRLNQLNILPFLLITEIIHSVIYLPFMSLFTKLSKSQNGW